MIEDSTQTRKRTGRMTSAGTIRDAAASVFLEKGYQGTSMDDIAATARVSKQTIYTHFANKQELFEDLVLGNADRVEGYVAGLEVGDDLEEGLRRLARDYVRFVSRAEVIQLRRLVIAEASRFPDLARAYYERVPARVVAAFADMFKRLADEGLIQVDDPETAARHFVWLALGVPLDRAMFLAETPTDDLDRIADSAVKVFLAAYR